MNEFDESQMITNVDDTVFQVDTCSKFLDLPACAAWEPDATAFLKLTTTQVSPEVRLQVR